MVHGSITRLLVHWVHISPPRAPTHLLPPYSINFFAYSLTTTKILQRTAKIAQRCHPNSVCRINELPLVVSHIVCKEIFHYLSINCKDTRKTNRVNSFSATDNLKLLQKLHRKNYTSGMRKSYS